METVQRKSLDHHAREANWWPIVEEASRNNAYAQFLLEENYQPAPPLQERFVDAPAYWDNVMPPIEEKAT